LKLKKIILLYLQKPLRNRITAAGRRCIFAIILLSLFLPGFISAQVIRKTEIEFKASDGLLVTANLYQSRKSNPFIILFHQEQSCKGEFEPIISRFIKLNYNCLAVDLRTGADVGFEKNKTAARAKEEDYSISINQSFRDIEAAIDYVFQLSGKEISLYGSASSANLALIAGKNNENVNAVVAFSPGEYLTFENDLKSILSNYPKPIFVAVTAEEFPYFSDIEGFPGNNKILFKPTKGKGLRGTGALLKENPTRDEYWLSLLLFFKSLN